MIHLNHKFEFYNSYEFVYDVYECVLFHMINYL